MIDVANSVTSGKLFSHYGPHFFLWKGMGEGMNTGWFSCCEAMTAREPDLLEGTHLCSGWGEQTHSGHGEGEWMGKGGEKNRELITSVTEHLLWTMHCVQGLRSQFLSFTTNRQCKNCCLHFTEGETEILRDDVTLQVAERGFKIRFLWLQVWCWFNY